MRKPCIDGEGLLWNLRALRVSRKFLVGTERNWWDFSGTRSSWGSSAYLVVSHRYLSAEHHQPERRDNCHQDLSRPTKVTENRLETCQSILSWLKARLDQAITNIELRTVLKCLHAESPLRTLLRIIATTKMKQASWSSIAVLEALNL